MAERNCVEELVNEIHKALENELYVIAVMAALTLPDMCGALEKENFWATNSTYMEWCKKNLLNCPHFARQIFDQSGVQACRTTASLYCLGER